MEERQKKIYLQRVIQGSGAMDNYYTYAVSKTLKHNIIIPRQCSMGDEYVWVVSGTNWKKFTDAPSSDKSTIATEYESRKAAVISEIGESWAENLFSVPDDGYIYFRKNDNGAYEFALAAWGYKYPDRPEGGKLEAYIEQTPEQKVNIAFRWDGDFLKKCNFELNGNEVQTDADGFFCFAKLLKPGTKISLVTPAKTEENFSVELGKADYIFDVTQYVTTEIEVLFDGKPIEGVICDFSYNGRNRKFTTDKHGKILTEKMPLAFTKNQPCVVKCKEQRQEKTPTTADEKLQFKFEFNTPVPPKQEPQKPEIKPEPKSEAKPEIKPDTPPKIKVKRKFPWWILLFLLPLLFLIKCNKTITVSCYEPENSIPITGQEVDMQYVPHFVYNNGKFFPSDTLTITKITDSTGLAVFDSLPCSVFSYVFYCLQEAKFSAVSGCHAAAGVKKNFHFTKHVDLVMEPRKEDLYIKLIDKHTGDELTDGVLYYTYVENGQTYTDSAFCDEAGIAKIPQMRYCSKIDLIAKCYGYADTMRLQAPCDSFLIADNKNAMRLRPIKQTFTFFVKNVETKQPIVGATAVINLAKKGKILDSRTTQTSIKGKGIGRCDTAFILLTVNIKASKKHFRDSTLQGGPYTVVQFVKQPPEKRTIWLKPEPFTVEFQNIDSITGNPIAGVKNIVTIYDPNGSTTTDTVMSNSSGYFHINAKEGSKIVIKAYKSPLYKPKTHIIKSFGMPEKIKMQPDLAVLVFRTVEDPSWSILPNCNLTITGSISGSLTYRLISPGVFEVSFRKDELLSITASKTGYVTNFSSVKNASYNDLDTPNQKRRDIPLTQDPPPPYITQNCSGGQVLHPFGNTGLSIVTYDMGMQNGIVTIELDFDAAPDEITVFDGTNTSGAVLFGPEMVTYNRTLKVKFNAGAVTIKVNGDTNWTYNVICP